MLYPPRIYKEIKKYVKYNRQTKQNTKKCLVDPKGDWKKGTNNIWDEQNYHQDDEIININHK